MKCTIAEMPFRSKISRAFRRNSGYKLVALVFLKSASLAPTTRQALQARNPRKGLLKQTASDFLSATIEETLAT
jgi:hypothetical protein